MPDLGNHLALLDEQRIDLVIEVLVDFLKARL
jgi:hypothetical protein